MELLTPRKRLAFTGRGSELFGVLIVNFLFTLITLGLYYPWAKARTLQYIYGHVTMDDHPFHFHGTGKEMFIGFIKAIIMLGVLYGGGIALIVSGYPLIGALLLMVLIMGVIPLVIHGSLRYRSSRSSWRGIRFGYRGDKMELLTLFVRDTLLTVVTLGIYGAWFQMNLRNYLIGHLRFGNSSFKYKGDGFEFFLLNLKGYLLSIITLGVYFFWWQRDLVHYATNNTSWEFTDGKKIHFRSTATPGQLFSLIVGNVLLVIFTLGIGFAWAQVRAMNFITNTTQMVGDGDLEAVVQTEQEHASATADEVGDLLDIDLIF